MHESVEAALRAHTSQFEKSKQWKEDGVRAFNQYLERLIQIQTPNDADKRKREDVADRINRLVVSGLNYKGGMYVQPYGSFVSDLYTPTGDMDLAIEGCMRPQGEPDAIGTPLASLPKREKAHLLRGLMRRLTGRPGLVDGNINAILQARVPIIKFTDARTGIACDVSVASDYGRFKSKVLGYLALIDPRFGALVRIVKKWAALFEINNATNGLFNTFALTNLVVFHLQQRKPPILPPLYRLWGDQPEGARPLQEGSERSYDDWLKVTEDAVEQLVKEGYASENRESLAELLASFFLHLHVALRCWADRGAALRASVWLGAWHQEDWSKCYVVGVEDPIDASDNCARSVSYERVDYMKDTLASATKALSRLATSRDAEIAAVTLFGPMSEWGLPSPANSRLPGLQTEHRTPPKPAPPRNTRGSRESVGSLGTSSGVEDTAKPQGTTRGAKERARPMGVTRGAKGDPARPGGLPPSLEHLLDSLRRTGLKEVPAGASDSNRTSADAAGAPGGPTEPLGNPVEHSGNRAEPLRNPAEPLWSYAEPLRIPVEPDAESPQPGPPPPHYPFPQPPAGAPPHPGVGPDFGVPALPQGFYPYFAQPAYLPPQYPVAGFPPGPAALHHPYLPYAFVPPHTQHLALHNHGMEPQHDQRHMARTGPPPQGAGSAEPGIQGDPVGDAPPPQPATQASRGPPPGFPHRVVYVQDLERDLRGPEGGVVGTPDAPSVVEFFARVKAQGSVPQTAPLGDHQEGPPPPMLPLAAGGSVPPGFGGADKGPGAGSNGHGFGFGNHGDHALPTGTDTLQQVGHSNGGGLPLFGPPHPGAGGGALHGPHGDLAGAFPNLAMYGPGPHAPLGPPHHNAEHHKPPNHGGFHDDVHAPQHFWGPGPPHPPHAPAPQPGPYSAHHPSSGHQTGGAWAGHNTGAGPDPQGWPVPQGMPPETGSPVPQDAGQSVRIVPNGHAPAWAS